MLIELPQGRTAVPRGKHLIRIHEHKKTEEFIKQQQDEWPARVQIHGAN